MIKALSVSLILIWSLAWSLCAHAALRGTASQVNLTSGTTVAVTVSGIGIQVGDVLLWGVVGGGGGTDTFTPPSGWAVVPGFTKQNISATAILYYKVATSTEVSATTLTMTVSQNDFHSATVAAFSGRNTSSPFTTVAQTAPVTGAGTPITFATTGVTAAAGDDIAVFQFLNGLGVSGQVLTFTPPSGYGDASSPNPTVSFSQTIAYADSINVAAGATGTLAGGLSNSKGAPANYGSAVVSIAQAGGATCTNQFWSSSGTWAVPNGSTGLYWSTTGAFTTPNCSTGSFWLKSGAKGAT